MLVSPQHCFRRNFFFLVLWEPDPVSTRFSWVDLGDTHTPLSARAREVCALDIRRFWKDSKQDGLTKRSVVWVVILFLSSLNSRETAFPIFPYMFTSIWTDFCPSYTDEKFLSLTTLRVLTLQSLLFPHRWASCLKTYHSSAAKKLST